MTAKRTPQGGLPRPAPKHRHINVATVTTPHIDRMLLGRYRCWWSKENRYIQPIQIGAAFVCVTNDFGDLVTVWEEPQPWR